eukprot:2654995-Amphidinium_carterae.1
MFCKGTLTDTEMYYVASALFRAGACGREPFLAAAAGVAAYAYPAVVHGGSWKTDPGRVDHAKLASAAGANFDVVFVGAAMSDMYRPALPGAGNPPAEYVNVPVPGASVRMSTSDLAAVANEHAYMTGTQWSLDEGVVIACLTMFQTHNPAVNGLAQTSSGIDFSVDYCPCVTPRHSGIVLAYYSA